MTVSAFLKLFAAATLAIAAPAAAQVQVQTVDPNAAGAPTGAAQQEGTLPADSEYYPVDAGSQQPAAAPVSETTPAAPPATGEAQPSASSPSAAAAQRASQAAGGTVAKGDVLDAAEGVFGRGAEGLAGLVEDLLKKQGEPSAYITGREASGALVVGVRYGSGTLHHGVEGDRPVYWTGPSLGFDFGADANKVFVLVYNLHDSQKIFKRYPAAEGNAYVVGGFTASYMRRGDTVLIPIRLGVGARLGVNAGYMKFSEKGNWFPF
jgi:hypothetical protein